MRKQFLSVLYGILVFLLAVPSYSALIYELNFEYSGGTSPAGPAPWLVATFENDPTGAGRVNLTLDARRLTSTEFVSNWYFNINPGYTGFLGIYPAEGTSTVVQNAYSADTAVGFDFVFNFPTNGFGESGVLNYFFLGIGLIETDFGFTNASGSGPFYSAANVQTIGTSSGSGWIGTGGSNTPPVPSPVPEPATILLLGLGLSGMAFMGRRVH